MKTLDYTDLRRGQELFWTLITSPKGVRATIEALRGHDLLDEETCERLFTGDGKLPAVERLDIYANMYFFRLLDCLGEDFSKVRAAIGPDRFETLIADYLSRHPSESPSLRFLGRRLPEFIPTHPISSDFPWLSDLARLEWARADIFDAVDVEPLSREGLSRLPQDRAGEAGLSLIPALTIMRFDYEVVRLWRLLDEAEADEKDAHGSATGNAAHDGSGPESRCRHEETQRERLDPPALRSCVARIWRQDFAIHHCSIDAEEANALELARSGESLARICQAFAAGRSVSKATSHAGRMIQTWLDDGLIAGVTLP